MLRIPHRAILSLTGPDTLALLERTVTHTVADWREGEMRYGGLLTPQGKLIADYLAVRTGDGVLIDVHEDAAEDLLKRLKMFRLRSAVEIERRDDLAVVSEKTGDDDPRSPKLWWREIVPATAVTGSIDPGRYEEVRIAAGVPEWSRDYRAAEVFPTDINMDLMDGIDYRKGCFVGQEVASRMKRKGLIRKRTVRVTGDAMAPGAELRGDETVLGTVTSAAGGEALALVRTDRLAKALRGGADLSANGSPARLAMPDWLAGELKAHAEAGADE